MTETIYRLDTKKEELKILKDAIGSYTKMVFETLKDERKKGFESKELQEEVVKCIDLKDKLDRVRGTIRKDNLTFFGNFEDKPSIEEYYKSL